MHKRLAYSVTMRYDKRRMKTKLATLVVFFLTIHLLSASPRGKQELVQAGSWVYDALAALSIEQGHTDFSDQAPLSLSEIELYVHEINYELLSAAGKAQYNRILDYIAGSSWTFSAGLLSFGIEPEANLEGYFKTNKEIEWGYNEYFRKPLLATPFTFMAGDYFTLSMDIALEENARAKNAHDNYTNIPVSLSGRADISANFPHTAYGSTGIMLSKDTGVNLQVGMGAQNVGRSLMGSIIWSDHFTDASYANLSVFSPNIRYNMNITEYNVDKYMYTHRFDVRLFKKVSFTVMESMLVYAPLELRFLNPLTIFHGTSAWEDYDGHETNVCDYMAFKLTYTPVKYIRLYALFAQDQWQTLYERKNWPDDTTPNAISVQGGAESFIPFGAGYLHFWLEGSYTDPFMYIKESPNWSLVRTSFDNIGIFTSYMWLGSPLGPDTIAFQLSSGYERPGKWNVTVNYLFKACGEYSGIKAFSSIPKWSGRKRDSGEDTAWVYPNKDGEGQDFDEAKRRQALIAPSGTPEYIHRISLNAGVSPHAAVSFAVQPAFVFIFNNHNEKDIFACGFECALSTTISFTRIKK